MNRKTKIIALLVCAVLICLAAIPAFATGVGLGMGGTNGTTGTNGVTDGRSGIGNAMDDIADGINDMFPDNTLGDRNGDGIVEDNGNAGMMNGTGIGSANRAPDDVLNTTGNNGTNGTNGLTEGTNNTSGTSGTNGTNNTNGTSGANNARSSTGDGTAPMSENGTNGAGDRGVSWTGIIIAVLLAAALVAIVVALIPKKEH